jgi:hypothetical protein
MVRARAYEVLERPLKYRRLAVAIAFAFLAIATWAITFGITLGEAKGGAP